jgi:hypothetical protein
MPICPTNSIILHTLHKYNREIVYIKYYKYLINNNIKIGKTMYKYILSYKYKFKISKSPKCETERIIYKIEQ